MTILLDAIAAETATLVRLVPTPVEPFGYGRDLSCVSDLTETMDEVDPFSAVGIAQALARRFQTARGSLPDDADYGLDLRAFLNRATDADEIRDLSGQAKLEAMKDDRVARVEVSVTMLADSSLNVGIYIEPADPNVEPFDLTLAVTSGEILLQLEAVT